MEGSYLLTGFGDTLGYETSMLPYFLDNRLTDGGETVNLKDLPRFIPQKYFLTLISLRSRSQGP
jgi:hypothetical protein